ncbi:MAG TPA: LLM class flavin-dependent oxidoreductase [Cellulomonas sp.]
MVEFGLMMTFDTARRQVELAQWAEANGFDAVWLGEGRLTGSAIPPMTMIAAGTDHIKVGTGILPYRTRNVALLAATFKTLDLIAPGRMRMGLGAWWEPLASRTGLPNSKPLTAMREVITVSRELLAGRTVTYHGEFVDVTDIRFDGVEDDDGRAYDVPVFIGAVRFGMVALSGEIADGVLLDFLVPPSYTVEAWGAIRRGAARSGRDLTGFQVPQLIATSVDDSDPQTAIDDCKAFLTQYLAQQSHITEFAGADPEIIAKVKSVVQWPTTKASIREAMQHLPNSLVQSVCACGTTTQTLDKIHEYVAAGVTEATITPMGEDKMRTLEAVASMSAVLGV